MKTRGTKPPAAKKQGVAKRKRQSLAGLMPLEPRVMYDAAGAHTAASHMVLDPHHNDTTHAASATSASPTPVHVNPALVPPTTGTGNEIFVSGGNTFAGGSAPALVLKSANITDGNDQVITEVFVQENNPINGDAVAFNNGSNAGGLAGSGTNKEIFTDGVTITFDGSTFRATGNSGAASIPDFNTALTQLTFSSNVDPTGGGQRTSANFSFQFVDTQNVASQVTNASLGLTAGSPPPPPAPPATPPSISAGVGVELQERRHLVVRHGDGA